MKRQFFHLCSVLGIALIFGFCTTTDEPVKNTTSSTALSLPKPDADNSGITLPEGFGALAVVAETGKARHIAIDEKGTIFVKLSRAKDGNGIVILRDTDGDGKADDTKGFGGNYIGTGIALKGGYLYASSNTAVYRYKMIDGQPDEATRQTIVSGLPDKGQHESKSLALDNDGNIYVTIGAPSNVCQQQDRMKGSPGMDPCPILELNGGVWQFKADKFDQKQTDGIRYATGIRNIVGLDWNNQSNQLYAMQHGRDMFAQFYPDMFPAPTGDDYPSEEFLLVKKGSDFGWPYCYYDQVKGQKLLNPEYGGDTKTVGRCEGKDKPIMGFPGHWAPNGLLFYTGNQFPARYKNGAFIAFHGSWNRGSKNQAGYLVAFVPFGTDGKPSGKYEIFANGFAATSEPSPSGAKARPMGLAQGPDGSLYISDSQKGKIWRVMHYGK